MTENQRRNYEKRRDRIKAARDKGTHTLLQWARLVQACGHSCVRCRRVGVKLEKDHIIPIYQGGSDAIENLQPLCGRCNRSKGPEDINWVAAIGVEINF